MSIDRIVCPNDPEHNEFTCPVQESHVWVVDRNLGLIQPMECYDVEYSDDIYTYECRICGATAEIDDEWRAA